MFAAPFALVRFDPLRKFSKPVGRRLQAWPLYAKPKGRSVVGRPVLEPGTRRLLAVSAATDVARLPEPKQPEIVAKGEREILEAAKRPSICNYTTPGKIPKSVTWIT